MANTDLNTLPPNFSLRPKLPGEETAFVVPLDEVESIANALGIEGLLLVGVVVAIILAWLLRAKPSEYRVAEEETRELPPLKIAPKPARFEAKTAKRLPQKKCVEGSAYVTDGDTIVIKKTQIRLFGIDAPELNHPYGQKAKWAMVKLCKGQKIRAEITEKDAYGRTVARCYLPDGRDLSAELVKQGLAIDWPKFSGGVYRDMEVPNARKKMWLAAARQRGHMHVWKKFEASQSQGS
ncbi:MAG: thermonuclease family protein [Roseobacter sp.]